MKKYVLCETLPGSPESFKYRIFKEIDKNHYILLFYMERDKNPKFESSHIRNIEDETLFEKKSSRHVLGKRWNIKDEFQVKDYANKYKCVRFNTFKDAVDSVLIDIL